MAESDNGRVKINKDIQRSLIETGLVIKEENIKKASDNLGVSERTLRDWIKGKFTITKRAFDYFVCNRKSYIKSAKFIDKYWYVSNGAKLGGLAKYKKYGFVSNNENQRLNGWKIWWEKEGFKKYSFIGKTKEFKIPKFNKELAEFVGIVLGDGGITKYQLTITLNSVDDDKYKNYIIKIINNLFGVEPSIYTEKEIKAVNVVVSRKNLIDFLVKKVGLIIGNKTKKQVSVPIWILKNRSFSINCLKGLIDTDGSVVMHKYKVGGKEYVYKKVDFVNASIPLVSFVANTLINLGIKSRISGDRHVWIDSKDATKKYFEIVRTSNPKHLMRFSK